MWDATSRSVHFRFDALRDGATNSIYSQNDSVIPEEPELRSTVNFSSPLKNTKSVQFYTPMPKSKKLDQLDDSFARADENDLLDFDKI